jgi:hypothetical protein
VNNELGRIWKEEVVTYYLGIEKLRKITSILGQDNRFLLETETKHLLNLELYS